MMPVVLRSASESSMKSLEEERAQLTSTAMGVVGDERTWNQVTVGGWCLLSRGTQ
jgi:hypothetical protein